jgi:hypothetical protein
VAIILNIQREYAFKVILDDPLENAFTAPANTEVKELSSSAGFGLRADNIVNQNATK